MACPVFRRGIPPSASLPGRQACPPCSSRRTSRPSANRSALSGIGRSLPRVLRSPCDSRRSPAVPGRPAAPRNAARLCCASAYSSQTSRNAGSPSASVRNLASASGNRATARASHVRMISASAIALPRSETGRGCAARANLGSTLPLATERPTVTLRPRLRDALAPQERDAPDASGFQEETGAVCEQGIRAPRGAWSRPARQGYPSAPLRHGTLRRRGLPTRTLCLSASGFGPAALVRY